MSDSRATNAHRLALAAVLLAAAALRLAGLTHHLARGGPEYDERTIFVEPVLRMWRTGSLDPTVYTGYAGFFNHLIALPVALGLRLGAETGAATAVKYTGLLLAPAIAVERMGKGRGRGLWRVALAAAAAFAACAPFAVLQLHRQGAELAWAFQSYYGGDAAANRFAQGDASAAAAPLAIVATALGPVGCVLALAAFPLSRERRALLPWLAVVITAVVALA